MTSQKISNTAQKTKLFIVKKNGQELFKTDNIKVENLPSHIIIEGSHRPGQIDAQSVRVTIDRTTPNGKQTFKSGERLREVYYLNIEGTTYAHSGTFNSTLDNDNQRYQLDCELMFHKEPDIIEIDLDVW